MRVPDWLRESDPRDLRARVENLPLERLALGRRTLRALLTAHALTWGLALLIVGTLRLWAHPDFGGLELLLIGALLLLYFLFRVEQEVRMGSLRARTDDPAWSWRWCETLCRSWPLMFLLATAGQLVVSTLGLLVRGLLLGGEANPGGAALGAVRLTVLFLPTLVGTVVRELTRALLGLLGGRASGPGNRRDSPLSWSVSSRRGWGRDGPFLPCASL